MTYARPWNPMAVTALRDMLAQIEAGKLHVTKLAFVDDAVVGFSIECVDVPAVGAPGAADKPEWEATTPPRRTVIAAANQCPKCNARDTVDAGDGNRLCLPCNTNWRPGAEVEIP